MLCPFSRGDKEHVARSPDDLPMPDVPRDEVRRPGAKVHDLVTPGTLEDEVDRAREEIDELLPLGMLFPGARVTIEVEREGHPALDVIVHRRLPEGGADLDRHGAAVIEQLNVDARGIEGLRCRHGTRLPGAQSAHPDRLSE